MWRRASLASVDPRGSVDPYHALSTPRCMVCESSGILGAVVVWRAQSHDDALCYDATSLAASDDHVMLVSAQRRVSLIDHEHDIVLTRCDQLTCCVRGPALRR